MSPDAEVISNLRVILLLGFTIVLGCLLWEAGAALWRIQKRALDELPPWARKKDDDDTG